MDLDFHFSFGVNCDSERSMTFYDDKTVIFTAGKLCILFDLVTRYQRVIQIMEGCEVTAVSRCENHLVLAVKGRPPSICMFNLDSTTKRLYSGPADMKSDRYSYISVSLGLTFLAAQGYEPDWLLVIWLATTRELAAIFNPTSGKPGSWVNDVSFQAAGREEMVVVGKNVFRLYERQSEDDAEVVNFHEIVFEKYEEGQEYFSITWPFKENLAVSTLDGRVLFFRGIDLVKEISVLVTFQDDISDDSNSFSKNLSASKAVTCLACTPNKLLCVFAGYVVVIYGGEEIDQFEFSKYLYLSPPKLLGPFPGELPINYDFITYLDLSPDSRLLTATTADGQLLYLDINASKSKVLESILHRQHTKPIIAMDVARGRPLVATCSEQSVILWNYETKRQELHLQFRDAIQCLTIHPSGLYLALSFAFYCRICTITYDTLKDRKILDLKDCSKISFSYGGHLLALASTSIDIYDFLKCDKLAKLVGHAGPISSIIWKDDDTKLVSCDVRGIICEWDLVSWCKLWENTDIMSYSCLAVIPKKNATIAVGETLKCVSNGSVQWEFNCPDALSVIAVSADAKSFYAGKNNGSLEKYSLPIHDASFSVFAHNGKITEMKFTANYHMLFTVSKDGLLFAWKTGILADDVSECELGNSVLTCCSDLSELREKIKLLRMSIRQCEMAYECDIKLNRLKHEEGTRNRFVAHEVVIRDLNEKIALIKEEIEVIVFDSDAPEDLPRLEDLNRRTMFEQAKELDVAYKRTNEYMDETQEMVKKYDGALAAIEKDYTETRTRESNKEKQILTKIKDLENAIMLEMESNRSEREAFEEDKKKVQDDAVAREARLRESKTAKTANEKLELELFGEEIKRMRQMTIFMQEDACRKRKIATGQVDYDIGEKLKSVDVLRKECLILEDKLKANEKIAQNQDIKFFEMRKIVEDLRRCHSVSKNAVEGLKSSIKSTEWGIESCRKEIEDINNSIPSIEEKIRVAKEQCFTLLTKLNETVDGFRHKRGLLREDENILSKYKSMLHGSLSQTCDAKELHRNILNLFDQIKSGVDESLDPNLKAEFAHQIQTLQDTYQYIKGDPIKATKEQSISELKLSQENSKLLNDVHEIQKEHEKLRDVIFEMEVAMGMPHTRQAKITKKTNELRDKIEFIFSSMSQGREEKANEITKLDKVIEEQQSEIHRLQTELSSKQERGKK